MKYLFRGGTVVSGRGTRRADGLVEDEKILRVARSISAPEATPRSGAMSSRIAQMVAVDVLFTAVAHLDYDRAAASLEKSRESCRPHRVDGAPPLRRRY